MKRLHPCLLLATLAACQSFAPSTGEQIVGSWRTEVGGLVLVSTFTDEGVTLAGGTLVRYKLDGDTLRFETSGSHAFEVDFADHNTMVLTDQITLTEQVYERVLD